jgi:hypothetical protein
LADIVLFCFRCPSSATSVNATASVQGPNFGYGGKHFHDTFASAAFGTAVSNLYYMMEPEAAFYGR